MKYTDIADFEIGFISYELLISEVFMNKLLKKITYIYIYIYIYI